MTHSEIDSRSLLLHEAIASKLRAEPALLRIAHQNLDRWQCASSVDPRILASWRERLASPLDDLLTILTCPSEEATQLRQNSPFAGILSPREVWTIKRRFRDTAAT